jgi:hypothetical protein
MNPPSITTLVFWRSAFGAALICLLLAAAHASSGWWPICLGVYLSWSSVLLLETQVRAERAAGTAARDAQQAAVHEVLARQ